MNPEPLELPRGRVWFDGEEPVTDRELDALDAIAASDVNEADQERLGFP